MLHYKQIIINLQGMYFMKKALITGLISFCISISANADSVIGIYAGASIWKTDADGGYEVPDYDGFNVEIEESKGETNSMAYVALEHPMPYLPNIRVMQTNISHEGNGQYSFTGLSSVSFEGEMELNHTDFTFYYEVLDNYLSLDLGLTARVFDGYLSIGFSDAKSEIDSTLGMAFAKAQVELPLTGLGVGLELQGGDSGSEKGLDTNLFLQYESPIGIGIAGGYRSLDTQVDAKAKHPITKKTLGATVDFKIEGPYLSIFYHF